MCFSATASFSGAFLIGSIGAFTLRYFSDRRQIFLAMIPFLFAFQQLMEGILWMRYPSILAEDSLSYWASRLFLLVAMLWPIWIPLSLWVLEKIPWRRNALLLCMGCGVLYGLFFLLEMNLNPSKHMMLTFEKHRIVYLFNLYFPTTLQVLYGLAALPPAFLSSLKYMWVFGVLCLLGAMLAYAFYEVAFVSVWCFFSAWVSILILFLLRSNFSSGSKHA